MREDWEIKQLETVCKFQNGFAFKSSTFKADGTAVIRITNIQNGVIDLKKVVYIDRNDYNRNLTKYEIVRGDLLIAMSGATTGKIGIHKSDGVVLLNQRVGKFEPLKNLDKSYLFYFLSTKVEESLAISAGSAQPNLSTEQIKSFPIPIPLLEEQKQIVEILDKAFSLIEQAKAHIEQNRINAKELFQSKLNAIFSQKGAGWEEKKMDEVCEIASKLVNPKETEYQKLLHVGGGNIVTETGELIKLKTCKEEGLKSGKFAFDIEVVLYNKIRPYLVKVVRPNFSGLCSADMYPLTPNKKEITRDFLYFLLVSKDFTNYAISGSERAGMPKVNRKHLFEYTFSLPTIKTQISIIKDLEILRVNSQNLDKEYRKKLINLEELKRAILKKAFLGGLTQNEFVV